MQDTNHLTLVARVVKEPELKNLNAGTSRLDVNIAFNESRKNGDKWEDVGNFAFISYWGRQAESMASLLHKGQQLVITGHLHVNTWEKDGKKNSVLQIIPDSTQLVGGKKSGNSQETSEDGFDSSSNIIPW